MAQLKRPARYRSPPPLKIPALPNPIRFQTNIPKSTPRQVEPVPSNPFFEKSTYSISSSWTPERIQSALNKGKVKSIDERRGNLTRRNDETSFDHKSHLPVQARFPIDVPPVPTAMETHVEDNVHKLRLRLIDSELNHQRRSTDEYIKRTQKELSLSSPTPTEYYAQDIRPPSELTQHQQNQRILPNRLSRQTSTSTMMSTSSLKLNNRIAMEPDVQNTAEIERDLEIRQIQESLSSARRSKPTLKISNYSYDPRVHLYPLNEDQQYSSSNMDDLIDSMARRHLAYRRLDVAIDHQRRSGGVRSSYIEPPITSGRTSRRNDEMLLTRLTPRSQLERDYARTNQSGFHQMLRSRIDYYTRLQNDLDTTEADEIFRANSYAKLPPITPAHQTTVEHLIELPSDIFLASRAEVILSSSRSRKAPMRTFSKETRSGLDVSEIEHELSIIQHHEKNSQNGTTLFARLGSSAGDAGFFTDTANNDRSRDIRQLFPKVAIGVLFIVTLRHRAEKSRKNRKNPSASAAIHKIRLQEIIVALHRVYLEPDGPIYNVLIQTINQPIPLSEGLNPSSKHFAQAIDTIGDALRNIISRIVDFMPKDGILGTGKTSAVSNLLQDGNPFPTNYFWDCEKTHLEFNENKVININRKRAVMLIIGIFIFRALVTTLLIKPIKYRLILGRLSANQSANLKVLASIVLYVARRAAGRKNQSLAMPHEWQLSLYTDEAIQAIVQNAEMKEILTNCQQSLREWCEEYIRRIDGSHGKELRM